MEASSPEWVGICWDCEERWWFEVAKPGERCPEDYGEDDEHSVTYYRRADPPAEVER